MIIDRRISPRGLVLVRLQGDGLDVGVNRSLGDQFGFVLTGRDSPLVFRPDLTKSYTATRSTEAASAPLPRGDEKTYHLRRMPRTISAQIMLSDFSLLPEQILGLRQGEEQNALEDFVNDVTQDNRRRSQELLSALQAWQNSRALFSALTQADRLDVAYIASLSVPQSAEDGSAYTVDLEIKEIQTFQTQQIDNIDALANDNGASLRESGGVITNAFDSSTVAP